MRRASGFTQLDVAARVGRSQSVVSRWERGLLAPTVPDLVLLAGVLGQSLEAVAIALASRGRQRSRRGDSRVQRQSVGQLLRAARLSEGLDAWTLAGQTRIVPRRLRRLEAGAGASPREFIALMAVLPSLAERLRTLPLDTVDLSPKVLPGPNRSQEALS